jgi:hypothetical protein
MAIVVGLQLARLKREVARLKKERNFLCDAAAFFAQGIALRY